MKFGGEAKIGVLIPRQSYSHPFPLVYLPGMTTRTMTRPLRKSSRSLPSLGLFGALSVIALMLTIVQPATAQAPKPAPATPPAATTAPAVAAPSPKAVALAFAAALDKGDVAAAKSLIAPDDDIDDSGGVRAKWVDATVALSAALRKLDAAALARFGEPGKSISQDQLHMGASLKSIEQTQEKIDGDAATLTLPNQPRPLLQLRKVDGQWRLLAGPKPDNAADQLALYARLLQAVNRTTDEVAAGGHPSAESAARIFATRMLEARLKT
ncbi:MAG: hypothetical protein JWN40_4344 [Phycisphaerales bacterium]|nr:hypothetical protein [Phycisphaerales bacterium]